MDFVTSHFGKMNHWPVEHFFKTYLSSLLGEKVFNWSEVHLSEMTCYKIHTLIYSILCFSGFTHFMMFSDCQDILDQSKTKLVYQNMDQPLSHYWIASSHNTYLLGNQARNFFIPGWKTLNQKTKKNEEILSRSLHWTPNFTNPKVQFPQFKVLQSGFFWLI